MARNRQQKEKPRQAAAPRKEAKWIARSYSTRHEIQFLQKLGQHREETCKLSHVELLKRYRATMPYRANWGHIDPDLIRTWLAVMIGDGKHDYSNEG